MRQAKASRGEAEQRRQSIGLAGECTDQLALAITDDGRPRRIALRPAENPTAISRPARRARDRLSTGKMRPRRCAEAGQDPCPPSQTGSRPRLTRGLGLPRAVQPEAGATLGPRQACSAPQADDENPAACRPDLRTVPCPPPARRLRPLSDFAAPAPPRPALAPHRAAALRDRRPGRERPRCRQCLVCQSAPTRRGARPAPPIDTSP